MKLTEGNIFEEIDYAYHSMANLSEIERLVWTHKRYGIKNATKMLLLVNYIELTVEAKNDRS